MIKKVTNSCLLFIFLFGWGGFLWTIVPVGRVKEEFKFNPNSQLLPKDTGCLSIEKLIDSTFVIDYPKNIGYMDDGKLNVLVIKPIKNHYNEELNELPSCRISLEVKVDLNGFLIEPANRNIAAYTGKSTQKFGFNLSPLHDGKKSGSVWIYLVHHSENKVLDSRIPLFVFPVKIVTRSLGGLSINILILLNCASFAAMIFKFLFDRIRK